MKKIIENIENAIKQGQENAQRKYLLLRYNLQPGIDVALLHKVNKNTDPNAYAEKILAGIESVVLISIKEITDII